MVNQNTRIYYLHKGDNIPFYIGKTINIKNERLNAHKQVWGKSIFLEDIDEVPTNEWEFWESHYISLYKSWGFILKNKNNGGGGCITHSVSEITRTKIGNIHRGKKKPFSREHKKNLSRALKGKKCPPSMGENISKSLKGREVTWKTGKSSKPIYQYNLEGGFIKKWDTATKAVTLYGESIRNCALGKQKTSCGYKWSYEEK